MGQPIDFDYIQSMMDDSPQDWYSDAEALERTDAMLKKMFNQDGPRITVVDWRDGPEVGFRLEIDFEDEVERGGA